MPEFLMSILPMLQKLMPFLGKAGMAPGAAAGPAAGMQPNIGGALQAGATQVPGLGAALGGGGGGGMSGLKKMIMGGAGGGLGGGGQGAQQAQAPQIPGPQGPRQMQPQQGNPLEAMMGGMGGGGMNPIEAALRQMQEHQAATQFFGPALSILEQMKRQHG